MKRVSADLAVFTGVPEFGEKLHVGCPNIGDREALLRQFGEILDRRWLTNNGVLVQELEQRIARYVGAEHCIITCNGTIALELAIRACELTGEVIVPAMTFVATAHALQWQEITPVFCDIDPATHNIDPARIEELITPRTTGIIGVHLWGRPCAVEALHKIAQERKLKLLFDAAHAFGCSQGGRMIGNFGDAEIFSFHATKVFNTAEGGAVITNNAELAERIRLMRNFGFAGYDKVVHVGTNGKMSEFCAAVGLNSLDCLEQFIAVNRANYHIYARELESCPGLQLTRYNETERGNFQYIVVDVDDSQTGLTRDDFIRLLWAENVMARRYFYPGCHRMEPYRSYYPHAHLLLPVTERLARRWFALPTGTAIGEDEIVRICCMLRLAIQNSGVVAAQLASGAGQLAELEL